MSFYFLHVCGYESLALVQQNKLPVITYLSHNCSNKHPVVIKIGCNGNIKYSPKMVS